MGDWKSCLFMLCALCFHLSYAGDCMTGGGIKQAFVVGERCYWLYDYRNYSDWSTAGAVCQDNSGTLAIFDSEATNNEVASQLERPAFFGYHKQMDGTWGWVNGSTSYANSYTDVGGVHMAITHKTGEWETTHIDAKKYIYDLLCSIELDDLRCPDVTVAESTQSQPMPLYSGDYVTFICNDGFHVTVGITEQTFSCLPSNRWSFPARDCKPIECDLIDPPAYTVRNSEKHFVGDRVVYKCTNDTWFSAGVEEKTFQCKNTGKWVPPLEPCKFVRCDPPPTLYMGTLDSTVTLYGHTIIYNCITGYMFADEEDSKSITCQGIPPTWAPLSAIDSLNCTAISCLEPVGVGEGAKERKSQSDAVGFYQVYWCDVGETHSTGEVGTSSECMESVNVILPNDWERPIPQCIQVGCDKLAVEDAIPAFDAPVKYALDYPIFYNCSEEGYMFPGGATEMTITCMADEQWDYEIPLSGCDDSRCEDGWEEFDGACYFFSKGNSLGLRYEYAEETCDYKHSHLAMITSEKEAAWIATRTYDVYERDFWIGYHEDRSADWVWKGDLHTNFTNFAEGYPEYHKCTRSSIRGIWKDRNCDELMPYICKKNTICGPSPTIAYGSAVQLPDFPVNVGAKIIYVCDDGYIFKNIGFSTTTECMDGGFWSKISNCVVIICPPLNALELEVKGAWFDTTLNHLGSIVTYTCQDGKLFPDGSRQISIECLKEGQWSREVPNCKRFKCPKPASPATTPRYGYDEWGEMDYYSCDNGYSFADAEVEKLFWCSRDGTWLPTGQVCIRRACPIYSLPFATVTPETGVYEDEVIVECDYGYHFPDSSTRNTLTCEADGAWSEELPACIPTKCEGPTPPDIPGAYRDTDVINSGTVVNYTCLHDLMYINGDKFRAAVCDTITLRWRNLPTSCVDEATIIKTEHFHKPIEAENGQAYISIGYGILGTVFVLLIISDLVYLPKIIASCRNSSTPDVANLTSIESQKPQQTEITPKTVISAHSTRAEESQQQNNDESEYETDDEEEDIPTYQL